MNCTSKVWWFPLGRRVLGWGLAGALLWALPVVVSIGSLALYAHLHPSPPDPNDGFGMNGDALFVDILLWFCIISSGIFALMGTFAGGFAGFYASAKDVKNPLKSRFFRFVGRRTFWFLAATSLASGLTLGVLLYPALGFLIPFGCWFVISIALFFVGLWRAVNRALREATPSN